MLTRVSGGREGIQEYLELGHKQGREFSRDQLDERVILAGDLDFTRQIIDGIESQGERYLHITLSFREDELTRETMEAITEEFRAFMFSAFKDDEYNFYAEAHLPKIMSYEHRQTGELIERKPHIHIVVPKVNLLSGGILNPFGLVELSERHIDAMQEHINNKFGLASPKENRRIHFTDASDIIARYKEHDNFSGANKDLKNDILASLIERNVTSFEDFGKLVGEFGATKMRNAGRDNEYINVKLDGHSKGVNLRDYHFSRRFIELPGDEKNRILTAEIQRKYEIQGEARKDPANIESLLNEWHQFRAKEVKYLNSGNKKQYRSYRSASPAEREEMLAILEAKFYDKHPVPRNDLDHFTGRNPFDPDYQFKRPDPEQKQLTLFERTTNGPGVGRSNDDPAELALHPELWMAAVLQTAFEQSHSHVQAYDVPAPILAKPAATFNHEHQERYHEPERFSGKNPVGHEYGFKRPDGDTERNPFQEPTGSPPEHERGRDGGHVGWNGRRDPAELGAAGRYRRGHPGSANWEHDIIPLAIFEKALTVDRVRSLPGGRLVRPGRETTVLLPDHALDQLGNGPGRSNQSVRRSRHRGGVREVRGTGRFDDSVVSQVGRDFRERQRSGAANRQPEFREIKQRLDAQRLLAELSRSHGVMPDKYQITKAGDGSTRIRCGTRNLNVSDFLTKEMRLPWAEAATILRHSYGRQVNRHPETAHRVPPDRALWRQFQDQRRERGGVRSQLVEQLASERARQDAIKERLDEAKRTAAGLPTGDRKAALSIARMEYITANDTLKATVRSERAPFRLPVSDQYRTFLQERAQAGDEAALAELRRRSRSAPLRQEPSVGHIQPTEGRQEPNALLYRGRQVHYRVQLDGDVVYSLAGRPMVQDKGDSVVLFQTDRLTIETALRLAQAKFGDRLKLSGPAEFQERAGRIAAEAGLNVRFDNKDAEQIRQQRVAELQAQRDAGRRFVETQTETQPGSGAGDTAPPQATRDPGKPAPGRSTGDPEIER